MLLVCHVTNIFDAESLLENFKWSCVSFEKRWTGVNQNGIICGVNWTAVNCANSALRSYDSKVPDVRTANQVVTKWSSIYASY